MSLSSSYGRADACAETAVVRHVSRFRRRRRAGEHAALPPAPPAPPAADVADTRRRRRAAVAEEQAAGSADAAEPESMPRCRRPRRPHQPPMLLIPAAAAAGLPPPAAARYLPSGGPPATGFTSAPIPVRRRCLIGSAAAALLVRASATCRGSLFTVWRPTRDRIYFGTDTRAQALPGVPRPRPGGDHRWGPRVSMTWDWGPIEI